MGMKQNYKPKDFSKMIGVSVSTLQRWDNEGTLKAFRTPKDRRFYTHEQYLEYMGESSKEENKKKVFIYARVSNASQKDDLKNQIEFLKTYANSKGIIIESVISDIGSGLNFKRKNWNKLIDESIAGNVSEIIIAHKDRFLRFGYDWFEKFLSDKGVKITVVNNETLSPEAELIQDLISIIHVFSCRIYGLRKYKKILKEDVLRC